MLTYALCTFTGPAHVLQTDTGVSDITAASIFRVEVTLEVGTQYSSKQFVFICRATWCYSPDDQNTNYYGR